MNATRSEVPPKTEGAVITADLRRALEPRLITELLGQFGFTEVDIAHRDCNQPAHGPALEARHRADPNHSRAARRSAQRDRAHARERGDERSSDRPLATPAQPRTRRPPAARGTRPRPVQPRPQRRSGLSRPRPASHPAATRHRTPSGRRRRDRVPDAFQRQPATPANSHPAAKSRITQRRGPPDPGGSRRRGCRSGEPPKSSGATAPTRPTRSASRER